MKILASNSLSDYELLDSGDGKRLERFGKFVLVRPDPQIIWKPKLAKSKWQKADAIYSTSSPNSPKSPNIRGIWKRVKNIPEKWVINYQDISFQIKLSPFKHTGVFPEQAVHWEWINELIQKRLQRGDSKRGAPLSPRSASEEVEWGCELAGPRLDQPNILNLFGYTGIASLVAAKAGAKVTHVDGSYPTIGWARENQKLSNLEGKPIRWILDDCLKFVQRELKRGVKYDGILMDPPIYGHGPKGEVWDFNKNFPELLDICTQLLSPNPLFVIVNAYAISSSSLMLENILKDFVGSLGGQIESGELALKESSGNRLLSTGIFARWTKYLI
ncbi:class I SAM-dependent methyltransferase [Candidatus Daviesbacteria bacterium]|nr:class I SAM-dependent methyltransferase [Candidatus Daviesbacteria bacterium]